MTAAVVPSSRPDFGRETATAWCDAMGLHYPVYLLGRRGYYRDTMGEKGKNDRGIFDDAIALVTPRLFKTFNANTDPSVFRAQIATLVPGVYQYKIGIHGLSKPKDHQYKALVQAAPVTVMRDGGGQETGYLGVNIHHGGQWQTTSEGCQTIYLPQWEEFMTTVEQEMDFYSMHEIPYVLTSRDDAHE